MFAFLQSRYEKQVPHPAFLQSRYKAGMGYPLFRKAGMKINLQRVFTAWSIPAFLQ